MSDGRPLRTTSNQHVILGIDAAWTATQPSGVALVVGAAEAWNCVCVAPSYESFLAHASGCATDWEATAFSGTPPDIDLLLQAASLIAGAEPTLIAVDMPVSTSDFAGRRPADQAISKAFGAQGCSTHSPNTKRPGMLGAKLMKDLHSAGYPLATGDLDLRHVGGKKTIEVFPHPALLALLQLKYRVPYKVSKSSKYWKRTTVQERVVNLLGEFHKIENALRREFGRTHIDLPVSSAVTRLSRLKRYEDALDALSCAWVATKFIEGTAMAYGDCSAAIWVPHAHPRSSVERNYKGPGT